MQSSSSFHCWMAASWMDSNLRLKTIIPRVGSGRKWALRLCARVFLVFTVANFHDNVTGVYAKQLFGFFLKQWQQDIVEICKFPLLHLGMPSLKSSLPSEMIGNRALMESPPLSIQWCPSNLELPVMICLTWLYRD